MHYISTRGNQAGLSSAEAIDLGMVPAGGLFVPETVPAVDVDSLHGTYHDTASAILQPLLTDYSAEDLQGCITGAYTAESFDVGSVIELAPLDEGLYAMELWHGPTAAFKDVALQIMPLFMGVAKRAIGKEAHTVILVATSGDTGKAALEGFRNRPGVSIIVFYPHDGVSEIQKLQMVTTDGDNTHVVAVRGNFDDCQTGVKQLFGDQVFKSRLGDNGFVLSSANSINWGRLSPQIVYYFHSYRMLVERGAVQSGDPVDFCVPTGNFGNILAGYYAKRMGLPVRRLVCASNRNKILTDFLTTGEYDRNREFYRTMSPSMDILISSNLERFLFEVTGHDAERIAAWYRDLTSTGRFTVDDATRQAMAAIMTPGWVDEPQVLATIGETYTRTGYVLDTHTAVGVSVAREQYTGDIPMVVDSTASPYKFCGSVLTGMCGERETDEFRAIERVQQLSGQPVHRALAGLRDKQVRHSRCIDIGDMNHTVRDILGLTS